MSTRIAAGLLAAFLLAGCESRVDTKDVLQSMQRLNTDHDLPLSEKFARLSNLASAFGDAPGVLSDIQLRDAFTAASMTLFYATLAGDRTADRWLDQLQATYSELQRRALVDDSETLALFDHLITLRRFDDASALKLASAALSGRIVPSVHFAPGFDERQRATMTLRQDGEWDVANAKLGARSVVAVVGCANSAGAVSGLASDAALMQRLDDANVLWLTDASALAMEGAVAWWNAELPNQPVQVAWRNDVWTGIDFGTMPTFHYVRNGRVIGKHDGAEPSTPREIRAGLEALSASP